MNFKYPLLCLALSLVCIATAQSQTRYSYSSDGAEVVDSATSLTWRRCVEGMSWSGTACTGSATRFKHDEALTQAKSQTGWRLPNVKELASIVDESRLEPAIDTAVFPNLTDNINVGGFYHWTSTPQAGFPGLAWLVSFYDGMVSDYMGLTNRNGNAYGGGLFVRLVRSTP